LKNGAERSYFVQAKEDKLNDAFNAIKKLLPKDKLIIIESAALHKIIEPAMFIFVLPDGKVIEKEIESTLENADLIVVSSGKQFFPSSKEITHNLTALTSLKLN
jgi:L-rhamnose isomerase